MLALYGFLNPMDSCPIYSVDIVKRQKYKHYTETVRNSYSTTGTHRGAHLKYLLVSYNW